MKTIKPLAYLLVAVACGGGGDGGGGDGGASGTEDQVTDEDQSVIVAEVLSVVQSAVSRAFATPILSTKPATSAKTLQPMGTFACGTATGNGSCSCTVGGESVQCHVVIDDQELCEVSGSTFMTGTIDAVGTPDTGSVDGEIKVSFGPPSCVVSPNDRLALDGLFVTTVTARSGPGYSHVLIRMVSTGLTVSRRGKEIGVCLIDITATESGVSGMMCGKPFPPPMPKSTP